MDILGDAENHTFYRARLKMNPRVTAQFFLKLGFQRMLVFPRNSRMDVLGAAKNPTFYRAQLKMNPRATPRFSGKLVLKACLFSQGFQEWISWAMLKIPHFTGPSSR